MSDGRQRAGLPRPRRRAQPRRGPRRAARIPPATAGGARDPARGGRGRSRGSATAGFLLIVATNQPDVARGTPAPRGRRGDERPAPGRAAVAEIRVCYDGRRRLPPPQAEPRAAAGGGRGLRDRPGAPASWSATAGATSRPGARAGCRTVFIDRGYDERRPDPARRPRRRRPAGAPRTGSSPDDPERRDDRMTRPGRPQGQDLRRRRRPAAGCSSCTATRSIKGFTTNPTLMRTAGIADYEAFAREIARGDPRPADLVRGLLRRLRRDGAPRPAGSPPGARTSTSRSR